MCKPTMEKEEEKEKEEEEEEAGVKVCLLSVPAMGLFQSQAGEGLLRGNGGLGRCMRSAAFAQKIESHAFP